MEFLARLAYVHKVARVTGHSPESVAQAIDSILNAYAHESEQR